MNNVNVEEICKRYLEQKTQITKDIFTCFDSLVTTLYQIKQAADEPERTEAIRVFVDYLVQVLANQLVEWNELMSETLQAQLKAELLHTCTASTGDAEYDAAQVLQYTVCDE